MAFPELFSKRGKSPATLTYDIPKHARNRVLMQFQGLQDLPRALQVAQYRLTERYGWFTQYPGSSWDEHPVNPAVHHFLACTNEQSLDFIEVMFTST
jgi:hypothetical protein